MNIIDIIFLAIAIPILIQGVSKGFISQVILLITLFAGTYFAYLVTRLLGNDIAAALNVSPQTGDIIVFAVAFIAIWILLAVLGMTLKKVFKFLMLEWLDKLLGGVFSIATTVLSCGLLVIMFDSLNDTLLLVDQEYLDRSLFYHRLEDITRMAFPYIQNIIPAARECISDTATAVNSLPL